MMTEKEYYDEIQSVNDDLGHLMIGNWLTYEEYIEQQLKIARESL